MKRLSVLFAVVTIFVATGFAQAQKVASMDYEAVLAAMPETKKMSDDLEAYSKTKGDELNKMGQAFQTEVQEFQKAAATMTDAQRQAKGAELEKKQENLQQIQQTAQNDLVKRRDTAIKPIMDKLNASVAKVAKANGWDFVIDSSAFIYKAGPDATDAVKKDLGIQ